MSSYILVVDDTDRVPPIVEAAVAKTGVQVLKVREYAQAKRKMVQAMPELVLGLVSVRDNQQAGFAFCRELKQHPQLRDVPVVLVTNALTDEVIRGASESGAKGLVSWPVSVPLLRNRIVSLAPSLVPKPDIREQTKAVREDEQAPAKDAASPAKAETPALDPKLELAQHLLAKVLHNLKTSALLDIVELEEVPKVVAEIARSVCGVHAEEKEQAEREKSKGETVLDLDSAFGLKK